MTTAVDLEYLLANTGNNEQPQCESPYRHTCTTIARWACYAQPSCNSKQLSGRYLWCDGRYNTWTRHNRISTRCYCGRLASHITVVPL